MNFKIHFLYSYLEYFPENLDEMRGEKRKRSSVRYKCMKKCYQESWIFNMLANYYWGQKRDTKLNSKFKVDKGSFDDKTCNFMSILKCHSL